MSAEVPISARTFDVGRKRTARSKVACLAELAAITKPVAPRASSSLADELPLLAEWFGEANRLHVTADPIRTSRSRVDLHERALRALLIR
jgi:hypothetical protein